MLLEIEIETNRNLEIRKYSFKNTLSNELLLSASQV